MKDFKNSTKMVQGHHFASGGHVGHFARPHPVSPKPSNGDTVNGLTQRSPDMAGNALVKTRLPTTELDKAAGVKKDALASYAQGGQTGKPLKAFHVHNHFHKGKKMPGKRALAKIQKKAEGGLIGPKASAKVHKTSAEHQTPSEHSEFAKGGKIKKAAGGAMYARGGRSRSS